jgi:hypothetical protein
MPWFVKLAITVAVVWLLASVALFLLGLRGEEDEGGEIVALLILT